MHPEPYWGLPDPTHDPQFYSGVTAKRALAWVVDGIITTAIVALAIPLTAFLGLLVLPLLWLVVAFFYRTWTLSYNGATWGMRFFGIELRRGDGTRPDGLTAALHTGGFLAMTMIFPAQLISILCMLVTDRGQGLHDLILGTCMINRPD